MDIEKAFDSLDHNFLISTLEKYGFGQNFILWIKILLNDQESCVINGGNRNRVSLMVVKLQGTLCSIKVPIKLTQFQRFYLF